MPQNLPLAMNVASLIMSAWLIVPVYVIARIMIGRSAAVLSIVLLSFVPTYWHASIYGFPSVWALALACTAVALFMNWCATARQAGGIGQLVVSVLCLALATAIKADTILIAGILPAFVLLKTESVMRLRGIAACGVLLCVAAMGPLAAYAAIPVAETVTVGENSQRWAENFLVNFDYLFGRHSLLVHLKFAGPVFLVIAISSCLWALTQPVYRNLALLLMAMTLPAVLFWMLWAPNTARHLLPAGIAVAIGLAMLLKMTLKAQLVRYAATAGIILANYFSVPATYSTALPSTRLISSAGLLQQWVDRRGSESRSIIEADSERREVVGSYIIPYAKFAVLASAQGLEIGEDWKVSPKDGEPYTIRFSYSSNETAAIEAAKAGRAAGYDVFMFIETAESM